MNQQIKGCGKDDKPLTLYCIPSYGEPSPLSGGYYHVRCGYRPPSKIKNGILLCDTCVEKFGLPAVCDTLRGTPSVRASSHEGDGPPASPPHALSGF
jgi:hypothetical protein